MSAPKTKSRKGADIAAGFVAKNGAFRQVLQKSEKKVAPGAKTRKSATSR